MRPHTSLLVISALAGCGGSSTKSETEYVDVEVTPAATNPDGVAYPTDHIGWQKHVGKTRGDRIANLAFQGYLDSNRTGGLKTVSLADFYDPKAAKYKAIHIQIAATWCSICAAESDATVTARDDLVSRGAVLLSTIANGAVLNVGPTLGEFTGWMDKHKTNYTMLLDSRSKRLGPLGVTGFPYNVLLDPRTMEILYSDLGAPENVVKYVNLAIDYVTTQPASY